MKVKFLKKRIIISLKITISTKNLLLLFIVRNNFHLISQFYIVELDSTSNSKFVGLPAIRPSAIYIHVSCSIVLGEKECVKKVSYRL
jgi:hypothetical protein